MIILIAVVLVVDHRGGTAFRLWVMGRPLSGLLAMGRGKAAIGYRQPFFVVGSDYLDLSI